MSKLTAEFEFEIGDIVYFKTAQHIEGHRPRQFMITERVVHECHGGIQRNYKLNTEQGYVPEILLSKEEPAYRCHVPEYAEDRVNIIEAERKAAARRWAMEDRKESK